MVVFFGEEPFLLREVSQTLRHHFLSGRDAEFNLTRFDGNVSYRQLLEEVSTRSMFSTGKRLVLVEEADTLVAKKRAALESYLDHPSSAGLLLMCLNSFPSHTNLYKKVLQKGLIIDCRALKEANIVHWLLQWSQQKYRLSFTLKTAERFIELIGNELGLLDGELSRLSLIPPEKGKVTDEFLHHHVGCWRVQRVWDMLDTALNGQTVQALQFLEKLLASGENPLALLAQIAPTLRRLSAATQLFVEAEQQGQRLSLTKALTQVGVKSFVLNKTQEQIKKLGRSRGLRLLPWLIQLDLDLKGASRSDPRLLLEQLIIKISAPALRS